MFNVCDDLIHLKWKEKFNFKYAKNSAVLRTADVWENERNVMKNVELCHNLLSRKFSQTFNSKYSHDLNFWGQNY